MSKLFKIANTIFFFIVLFSMSGCVEKGYIFNYNSPYINQTDDHATFVKEIDGILDDANHIIEFYTDFRGRFVSPLNQRVICEATAKLGTNATERFITITYDGKTCSGTKSRLGEVVLSMPLSKKWKDAGAVMTVTIKNLIVTRLRDNNKIILNGGFAVTNVSGGTLKDLASLGTIVHEIKNVNGVILDFSNNARRVWYVSKKRTYTFENGIVISTVGTHKEGSLTGISEWGVARSGELFATVIREPIIIRQDCDYRIVGGKVTHEKFVGTLDVTFGLDNQGNPASCPGLSELFYSKLLYTNREGKSTTFIIPY